MFTALLLNQLKSKIPTLQLSPKVSKTKSKLITSLGIVFVPPKRTVNRVFIHCSASDNPEHDDVSVIKEWHLARKFFDVGYHFFITKDGTLQDGRDLSEIPAAQQGNNSKTIAICLAGLDKSKFTNAQFNTLYTLCRKIHLAYEGKITFHGHCEVSAKTCPVFDYKRVLFLNEKGYMINV